MAETRKPDAVQIPGRIAPFGDVMDQAQHLYNLAKELMGERQPIARDQGDFKFYSKSLQDTLLFAKEHPKHPAPRYTWEAQPDGIKLGYYVDGANEPS